MANNISILIETVTKGEAQVKSISDSIQTGFRQGKLAIDAFNSSAGESKKAIEGVRTGVGDLVKAYLSIEGAKMAFEGIFGILQKNDKAAFSLQASIQSASREFSNTGSLDEWGAKVKELSKELMVYSEASLKSAVSRTIDMTKRLGMSADQMTIIIKRTADLSAGKIELEEGIERVTSALRGEAEASEYLGLTLNETYVKAWYDAHNATGKAWKDLTDMEKAQVRYQVFLEQTNASQGRAAESAKTFSGALRYIQSSIENAITNNEDLAKAMAEVGNYLRDNAGSIGAMATDLVNLTADVIKFAIEWKEVIKGLLAMYVAGKGVGYVTSLVRGLSAAVGFLKAGALAEIGTAAASGVSGVMALAGALSGPLLLAFGACLVPMGIVIYKFWELLEVEELASEAAQDRAVIQAKADAKAKEYGKTLGMQITSMEQLLKLQKDGLIVYDEETQQWKKTEKGLQTLKATTGLTEEALNSLNQKIKAMGDAYKEIGGGVGESFDNIAKKAQTLAKTEKEAQASVLAIAKEKALAVIALANQEAEQKRQLLFASNANTKQAAQIEKTIAKDLANDKIAAIKTYRDALSASIAWGISEEKKFAAEVKALNKERLQAGKTTEELLREAQRKTMTETQAWQDEQKQAAQTLKQAFLAAWVADTPEKLQAAKELAQQAQQQFAGLAREVKEGDTTTVSMAQGVAAATKGIKEAGSEIDSIIRKQTDMAKANEEASKKSTEAKLAELEKIDKRIEELKQQRIDLQAEIRVDSSEVDAKLKELDGKVTKSTHYIIEKTVSSGSSGSSEEGFAFGGAVGFSGMLPGYGGGDQIRALLEAGEFVIRKEAVAHYGPAFFAGLNAMRVSASALLSSMHGMRDVQRFAAGGMVSAPSYGTLTLQAGGVSLPVQVAGPQGRDLVRQFEAALKKERLVKGR